MSTGLVVLCLIVLIGMVGAGMVVAARLPAWLVSRRRRGGQYDLLYSLRWGDAATNNYGFAPAEAGEPERFQLQRSAELLKLLGPIPGAGIQRVLEISCGRGGGLRHVALHLPGAAQVIGLDFSMHAVRFCRTRYAALRNVAFVRGHALQLPFADGALDLVINVEASHAYGDDAAFLREVKRVLRQGGRLLYADYRARRKVPRLERQIRKAGLAGALRDITANVVRACELDSVRRRALIRSGLPWWYRPFGVRQLEQYAGIPGSVAFERLRSGDRMYFIACLTMLQGEHGEPPQTLADAAA